jgi:hypothetical protein
LEKVATPLVAVTVVVPARVPELGLVPMAMAIDALETVTTRPEESSTVTTIDGEMVEPWAVFEG